MDEFSERLREASAARSRRASYARAPKDLRASIARARVLRIGGTGAVALVAIAGIGAAGAGFTGIGETPEPSPSPSVDLSIDDGGVAYATVPFPDEPLDSFPEGARELCGEPVPDSHAADERFSATFELPDSLDLEGMGGSLTNVAEQPSTTVNYSGSEPVAAFAEPPQALFLRDGIVIGVAWSYSDVSLTTFEEGGVLTRRWQWSGYAAACEGEESDTGALDIGVLGAGDYEVAFRLRVHNDQASAATHHLRMRDFTLPVDREVAALREGAYECGDDYLWGGMTPITCEPHALPGVEIDEDAGTVTVPYDTAYYSEDVDLTYYSAPIPVTLGGGGITPPGDVDDLPAYERGSVPACGDAYVDINAGTMGGTWAADTPDMRTLTSGDRLEYSMWLHAGPWTTAEIEVPTSPRLWILGQDDWEHQADDGESGSSYWYTANEVVGWIDTTSVSGDTVLELVRYDGPEPWALTVDDLQWCEGVDPDGDLGTNGDPTSPTLPVMIASPTMVTLDDGTSLDLDALLIWP